MFRRLNKKQKDQAGFTLIELLVVIAIIGLISSIAMTSLSSARKRGRDAKRIGDIRQINTAIQLYIDTTGHAPYLGANNCTATGPCGTVADTMSEWTALQADLAPYLSRLPKDPCGKGCWSDSVGKFYAYAYQTPSNVKVLCNNTPGCNLSNSQINTMYSIFAESMEVSSPNYIKTNEWIPTYGIIGHTINSNSF